MSIDADELTEAVAMPIAFHRLPVAAYTGAATITPCNLFCIGNKSHTMLIST